MSRRLPPKVESSIFLHRKGSFISLNKFANRTAQGVENTSKNHILNVILVIKNQKRSES